MLFTVKISAMWLSCSKIKQELAESEEVVTRINRMTELRNELQTILNEESRDDVSMVTVDIPRINVIIIVTGI